MFIGRIVLAQVNFMRGGNFLNGERALTAGRLSRPPLVAGAKPTRRDETRRNETKRNETEQNRELDSFAMPANGLKLERPTKWTVESEPDAAARATITASRN